MTTITKEEREWLSSDIFQQFGLQCQAASELSTRKYSFVTAIIECLLEGLDGKVISPTKDQLLQANPTGEAWELINKIIQAKVTRQVRVRSLLDMSESEEEWNCKDDSGTIAKYEMMLAYCIFDQVLDGVLQEPCRKPQDQKPCKRVSPGEKVKIIQAIGNTAYVVLDNQVCTMMQAISVFTSIWGWKIYETRRTPAQEKFPILRQHFIRWAGSSVSETESGTSGDPSGWDWVPNEKLINLMRYSDLAKGMLVYISRLPWCVLGPFGPTKASLGALLQISAQAISGAHISGQVGEWIHNILPRPVAQPPTQSVAWGFVNPDSDMSDSPGQTQTEHDDYNWMSSDECADFCFVKKHVDKGHTGRQLVIK